MAGIKSTGLGIADPDPEWSDLFGAAFRNENVVGSIVQRARHSRMFGDNDMTPVTDAEIEKEVNEAGLSPFLQHFTRVETRGDLNNKLAHIRQQALDKETLDNGGWSGFGAQLVAGVMDVPTLVPFGHAVRLGRLGTESLKTTASKLAMTSAMDASFTELGLQSTQDLRTGLESGVAIGGSVVLTTLLGTGAARLLSKRHRADLEQRMETELPKLADGRAEAEVAQAVALTSENTGRAMRGEKMVDAEPFEAQTVGVPTRDYLTTNGVEPADLLPEFDSQMRALLVGPDGKLYDVSKFGGHEKFTLGLDDATKADSGNFLQVTVTRGQNGIEFATSSTTPLTRKQLQGIRNIAKSYSVDRAQMWVKEDGGASSVTTHLDPAFAKANGYVSLSRYTSAENRAKAADKDGTPPADPELRQGLPNTRWDGEAKPNPQAARIAALERELADIDEAAQAGGVPRWYKPDEVAAEASLRKRLGPGEGVDGIVERVKEQPGGVRAYLWDEDKGRATSQRQQRLENLREGREETDGLNARAVVTVQDEAVDLIDITGGVKEAIKYVRDDLEANIGSTPAGTSNRQLLRYLEAVERGGDSGMPPDGPTALAGGRSGGDGGIPPGDGAPPSGGGPKALDNDFKPEMTPSQMAFADSAGTIATTRGLSRLFGGSPVLEMMNSTSAAARAWIMSVAELSGRTKGSYEGAVNPIAIQSRMAEYEGMRAVMTREFYDAYKGWRQGWDVSGKEFERFSRNVSQAIVRRTFDDPTTDPHVARAAKAVRTSMETVYSRAVDVGLLRKDAWKPGDSKSPFVDFDAARRGASDTEAFDAKDYVDDLLKRLADDAAGTNTSVNRLRADDANLIEGVVRDLESGQVALPDAAPTPPVRGSIDYNVALRFQRGPNGEIGDNLIQESGLINRRYTDRVYHERENFIKAETLARIQLRDKEIRDARAFNAELEKKVKEDAKGRGEDPEAAWKAADGKDPLANTALWHEIKNKQAKRSVLFSAANHAVGSWEYIAHKTIKGGDHRTGRLHDGYRISPLHDRNVAMSDEVLLAKGWIDDDALSIANHTVRQIASEVEIARRFRRPMTAAEARSAELRKADAWWLDGADPTTVPDIGMEIPRKVIGEDFQKRFDALSSGPENDAARNALRKERALILGGEDGAGRDRSGLLDTVTDMIRGTHNAVINSSPTAQNLDALRKFGFSLRMGSNPITNLTDIFAINLRHGQGALLAHTAHRAVGLVKSLSDPQAIATLAREWKLPEDRVGAILAREARAAGIAVETDLMSRVASQMDIMDPFMSATPKDKSWQQAADWLARSGAKFYAINLMTNAMRRAAYGIYTDRVIRMAMDRQNIGRHERDWLNDLGISDKMLDGIAREVRDNRGAVLDGGVWQLDTDKWVDARLRSDFWAAARKDVNSANVSPTAVDKPLFLSNPVAATIFQFWSFSFGATMRIMAQSAQRVVNGTDGLNSDGTRTLLGLTGLVAGGMMTFALHNYASTWYQRMTGTLDPKDELPDFQSNWRQWLIQGTSRSGVLGVFGQMGDVADGIGLSPHRRFIRSFDEQPELTDPVKKYGRPNAVKNVLGPSAGLLSDVVTAGTGVMTGLDPEEDLKRSQVKAIQRNLPFVNAWYLKSLTKEANEYLNDQVLALPPDRR